MKERLNMRFDYDVIVVGAGNAGLTAASRTAGAGLRTVLLEKHNLPGGYATSFVRGRFEFEASLHELCDIGTKEVPRAVRTLFSDLGSDEQFINEKNLFRTIVTGEGGYDVTLQSGAEGFRASFLSVCPDDEKSFDKLMKLLDDTSAALAYNEKKNGNPNKIYMVLKYGDFIRSASHSIDEVLCYLGFSERARRILETYWLYLGVPADEANSLHYLEMLRGYIYGGAGIPLYKSYGLSLSLADTVIKKGGEIRYNTEVKSFIYDGGRVVGVKTDNDEYYAKEVISNIIPHKVLAMSGKNTREKDRKLCNARKLGLSFVCIYIGLDRGCNELGINDYTVFISKNLSSRRLYEDESETGVYVVNCLNTAYPDATPFGTCSLFITVPVFSDKVMSEVTPENYKKWKSDFAKKYIEDYEKVTGVTVFPYIEEISVSTPATNARYFGSPDGTAYGYRLSHWDNLMSRLLCKESELDIDGLSFCGGHGANGSGFGVTYTSGVETADAVIKRIKG